MRVKCVKRFRDFKAGTFREVGATFDVDAKRFQEINSAGYGQLVDKVDEKPSEAVSEPRKTTRRTSAKTDEPTPRRRSTRAKKTEQPAE